MTEERKAVWPPQSGADLPLLRYRDELMVGRKLRKDARCWHCGTTIRKGEVAFAVFGNSLNRMQRVHAVCGLRATGALMPT